MPTSRRSEEGHGAADPAPECPSCRDARYVEREDVLIEGNTLVSFWTCGSCLHSWPAPPLRMAKADLKRQ